MAEVLMFHHILGRTLGMEALAERFRQGGHVVHLPDLFEGRVFRTRDEGRAHVDEVGTDTLIERARIVAAALPPALVYVGVSLGVLPAQLLTQTRLGARGAVLISAAVEPSELGAPWPAGVPLQVHAETEDALMLDEGDLDAARNLVDSLPDAELFLYEGSAHLFTEAGGPEYDPDATALLVDRVHRFLADR